MSHTSLQSNKTVIFSLYLIYFLDLASLVFVYVVLSDMIIDPASIFLAKTVSAQSRNLLIGILLGIYPLALFFAAPILGDLSDRFGRKPILATTSHVVNKKRINHFGPKSKQQQQQKEHSFNLNGEYDNYPSLYL
ncbi:MAG: MFS transporter [Simkania negevensis]|nr:MFS transporter [Simkania negevensis]